MEDLLQLFEITETYPENLKLQTEEWLVKLRSILWGQSAAQVSTKEDLKNLPAVSPLQTKKRVKRLTSLNEEDSDAVVPSQNTSTDSHSIPHKGGNISPRHSKRSNADLLQNAEDKELSDTMIEKDVISQKKSLEEKNADSSKQRKSEATNLMPPPPAPAPTPTNAAINEEVPTGRPQRAAKLKSEKCLKEPKLNMKIRRPTEENVEIKLEHEQRPSQMHEKKSTATSATLSKASINSTRSNDSIVIVPAKNTLPVEISSNSDEDDVIQPSADPVAKNSNSKGKTNNRENTIPEITEVSVRLLRINIKSEKLSTEQQEEKQVPTSDNTFKAPEDTPFPTTAAKSKNTSVDNNSMASRLLSSTANTSAAAGKKTRKKKDAPPHRPIKVERFSDLDPKPSPVASRTRHGSTGKQTLQHEEQETNSEQELPVIEECKRPGSVYEDAVETPPSHHLKTAVVNETVTLGAHAADATMNLGPVPGDATFCTNPAQTTSQVAPGQTTFVMDAVNPNATVTLNKNSGALGDATFDIHSSNNEKEDDNAGQRSFETAKDSSVPYNDTLITEDESYEPSPPLLVKQKATPTKPASNSTSAKVKGTAAKSGYKVPTRTNELFNPLAQSPVKMRVEAFENAAAAAATEQPKRPLRNRKENVTPTSATTPVIGKLPGPSIGRFLTPTQSSNVSTASSAFTKKVTTSASKAVPLTKSASSTVQRSNSNASVKTLQRENSADDFRKNLHNLAEERKKQREQKHFLAAQQREAKERERAERVAKLAKEREEKRLHKQQEKLEQQKREMEEIQRKLRLQQEEEAKIKTAKEREMLVLMKQQQQMSARQKMMPPPPKTASKYTFEMLHEDDSTDDEDKVSYKRPPPPSWSRRHNRGPHVLKQEFTPSGYIDSFFSVQPMTPDLKQIFPNIDARHLKRNSSVLWSTPPRYSELPKY